MLRPRVEIANVADPAIRNANLASGQTVRPIAPEEELDAPQLPHDHPKWVRDAVAISQRARRLCAQLRPVVLRILTFWDHRMRAVAIGGRRVQIDPSGSYKID